MGKKIDLTGQQFGYLTVIKDSGKRELSCGQILWDCKCKCGNEITVNGVSLRQGKTISCGCAIKERAIKLGKNRAKKYNLSGQKFGKLTVIEDSGKRNRQGAVLWKCQCECGNICYIEGNSLKRQLTKSCGCIGRSYGEYLIEKILKENNISFETQKIFNDCRFLDTNYLAYFDFYVNNQYIIEFDGSQHFKYKSNKHTWNNEENFIKVQEHDNFKNEYCFKNKIPIIRIPYTRIDDLCLKDLQLETSDFIIKPRDA